MIHAANQSPPNSPAPTPPPAPALSGAERDDVEAYYRTIAPFYDAEQADRDDLGFWRAVAERHQGGRFLDLGAGSGLVTAELAPFASELAAVDVSPELLRLAQRRLAAYPGALLLLADMLALPFGQPFDLIVAANDPLSHLTEDAARDRALDEVARHLAPGGRFVLDALWLAPDEAAAVARKGGRVKQRTATVQGERLRVIERWERWERPRGRGRCCLAHYEYHRDGRRPVVADFEAHDWSPGELFGRLERAGLAAVRVWGGYHGEVWHPQRASQLIVEAAPA